jgi:hypothetical protein
MRSRSSGVVSATSSTASSTSPGCMPARSAEPPASGNISTTSSPSVRKSAPMPTYAPLFCSS